MSNTLQVLWSQKYFLARKYFSTWNTFWSKIQHRKAIKKYDVDSANTLETWCSEKPKLRIFIKFEDFHTTPAYISKPLSFIQRKFLERLGCLEIRMETGRFARPRIPQADRTCQVCPNPGKTPESKAHFLLQCEGYACQRSAWLSTLEKPTTYMWKVNCEQNVKKTAQYIISIYDKNSKIVSNLPSTIQDRDILYHIHPHDHCPACNNLDYYYLSLLIYLCNCIVSKGENLGIILQTTIHTARSQSRPQLGWLICNLIISLAVVQYIVCY